ncbi:SpdA-like protein [Streptomyces ambofaciens ATCC 23877]|uniref:SpdA-like protein n=1 Tax=Streptomyces ambofaciens (strain ATCC 23877 / 3486 / DSM 40053 / JCM 4204 / NBRC 12836 / NRRL B-2516) TaxID=278992 RepID=A0A0K2B2A3_STRA7|nr:DUF2637 domain-containing protein [Streptomyces ambofaciens]AKZ59222.1 SpdA-like protein [Streptomyces ambofaciens ATCC 23877]WNA15417.1 putative DNA binding protein [Streptomyces phage Samy]
MRALRRLDPLLIQAIIAAALSFAHIHDIAEAAGQGGWKAWAYPVSVDVLLVMAWKRVREAEEGESIAAARLWFWLSLAASMSANVATAGVIDLEHPPTMLRVLVAAWPVLAFFGGSLLVHSRKAPTKATEGPQEAAGEPAGEPVEEVVPEPVEEPQRPNLVTYAEAAAMADVAPETIRGAANGPKARLTKYETNQGPRVDLDEVRKVYSKRPAGV